MKVGKSSEGISVPYKIESKLGSLECTFYHENVEEYFYTAFSPFAGSQDDFESKTPSFEKYVQKATEIFVQLFPKRLEELIEETVEEVELRTLMETEKITLREARQLILKALRQHERKKKERINAPSAGRPRERDPNKVVADIRKIVNSMRLSLNPTRANVGSKLDPPMSAAALSKYLLRHGLDWNEIKKRDIIQH